MVRTFIIITGLEYPGSYVCMLCGISQLFNDMEYPQPIYWCLWMITSTSQAYMSIFTFALRISSLLFITGLPILCGADGWGSCTHYSFQFP